MKAIKTFEAFTADDFEPTMVQPFQKELNFDHKDIEVEHENYMFFGNLHTIKRHIDELLKLDPAKVDEILSNGHAWADDHIATSKDDIEEVFNFLVNDIDSLNKQLIQEDPI